MRTRLVLLTLVLAALSRPARAEPAAGETIPVIDVYTMGPGDELFGRFGHAAICVTDKDSPAGRCYNYGTADFSTPGPLTFGIIRGRAVFWVSVVSLPRMLAFYVRQDRTVYRQRLPYDERTARAVAATLHASDVRSATYYHYHHFNDNCTTRIRDLLDLESQHTFFAATSSVADAPLRSYVRAGLAGEPALLALSELVLGRAVDRPGSRWQGMFLPAVLRDEVARRFFAPAEVVYKRQAPLPTGSPHAGTWLLCALGAALAGLIFLGARLGHPRLGRLPAALVLGSIGLVVSGLVIFSPLLELRYNEVLLLCWPTDLSLLLLSRVLLRRYCAVRLVVLLLCALAAAVGLLHQPLYYGPLLLCGLPLLAVLRTAV